MLTGGFLFRSFVDKGKQKVDSRTEGKKRKEKREKIMKPITNNNKKLRSLELLKRAPVVEVRQYTVFKMRVLKLMVILVGR